ncbi:adenosine deaminase [Lasiosphaeria miniovina]|uniref:Adenosine deaminase n=1 Tax=Lasiosphaeria miniovina TaxID=1954250 RepID=A0AA40ATH9_9PEZI|nr:adenosine deaminase [Lasiosphaeria miniovina]KAK0721634.1 adenosine deaminase [Lasiosphaeria miniovina]
MAVNIAFTKGLPKVELHAHLTGSISVTTLHEIWQARKDSDASFSMEDPLVALPLDKVSYDVVTFFPLFDSYIYDLCSSVAAIRRATLQVLRDFRDDGVRYLELRTTPRENVAAGVTKETYVSTVLSCLDEFAASAGSEPDMMPTYLILSVDRRNTAAQAMQTVELAVQFQARGVVGVDLCGNPAMGDVAAFGEAFARAREAGLKVTLHFAEISESATRRELQALLGFRPDRLGHVIHVPDDFRDEIARRDIGLELCLSCNVHAKLIPGGFADHHFGYWKDTGCSISLCTDDVGIFRSSVSNEYLLAAEHFSLGRADLLKLSKRAVDSIFGGEAEKERMRRLLTEFEASL